MFKRLAICAMAAILVNAIPAGSVQAAAATPTIHGRAALLLDGRTGQVLFDYNGNARNFPASTTKLLTALVAVEHGNLDQVVKVSAQAVDQAPDSSSCYINKGEEQKLEYLLLGLLLVSGNDCAMAIAEGLTGGNADQFVAWMNETAKRVGATHSHFTNPHGLHDSGHYTTAYDLALIGRAALSNPTVLRIAGTKEFNWPGKTNGTYYNHNSLLFTYDPTVGGKNGFTEQAGLTLVERAEKDGRWIIGVVMGVDFKSYLYDDMENLLDYGFDNFEHRVAVSAGAPQGNIAVVDGKKEVVALAAHSDVVVAVPKGSEPKLTMERRIDQNVKAPVSVGQQVGTLDVKDGDRLVAQVPITTREAVEAKPPILQTTLAWALSALKWLSITFVGLFLFRLTVKSTRRLLRAYRRRSGAGRRAVGRQGGAAISGYRVRNRP